MDVYIEDIDDLEYSLDLVENAINSSEVIIPYLNTLDGILQQSNEIMEIARNDPTLSNDDFDDILNELDVIYMSAIHMQRIIQSSLMRVRRRSARLG